MSGSTNAPANSASWSAASADSDGGELAHFRHRRLLDILLPRATGGRVLLWGPHPPALQRAVREVATSVAAAEIGETPAGEHDLIVALRAVVTYDAEPEAVSQWLTRLADHLPQGARAIVALENDRSLSGLRRGLLAPRRTFRRITGQQSTVDTVSALLKLLPAALGMTELHGIGSVIVDGHLLHVPLVGHAAAALDRALTTAPLVRRLATIQVIELERL